MLKSDLKNVNKMRILGTEKSNHERKLAVIQISMKENNLLSFQELSSEKKRKSQAPFKTCYSEGNKQREYNRISEF